MPRPSGAALGAVAEAAGVSYGEAGAAPRAERTVP